MVSWAFSAKKRIYYYVARWHRALFAAVRQNNEPSPVHRQAILLELWLSQALDYHR